MKKARKILCMALSMVILMSGLVGCISSSPSEDTTAPSSEETVATSESVDETTEEPTEETTEEPTEEPTVTITFSPGVEGMEDATVTLPVSAATLTLPEDPTREGYAFKGWYTQANGEGDRVSVATALTDDTTYYAKWTPAIDMTNRNHIRIGGFNGITESRATESDFAALAECGIDEIYMTWFHEDGEYGKYSLEKSLQYMEWMEKYGIECWYNDFKLNDMLKNGAPAEECMALLNVYKDSPSYCGNYLVDEPAGAFFPELITAVNNFQEIMPEYEMYINLIACIAPPTAFVNDRFEDYIQAFVDDFPLSYVSHDFYPIDIVNEKKTIISQYYFSLYTQATIARDANKESWMYIYTMRDTVNDIKDYEPQLSDVRFEAGNALAFGNNHISYYCFDCPPSYSNSDSFGMLKDHQTTTLFNTGKQLTKEIKALSDVFPKYLWKEATYIAENARWGRNLTKLLPLVTDVLPFEMQATENTIIGIFEEANGDGEAYMLANNADLNEPEKVSTITFSYSEAQQIIAHIGTEVVTLEAVDGVYTVELTCGQFCFLEVIR